MDLLPSLLATFVVFLVCLFFYLRRYHGYLESLGIPIVPSGLFIGSPPYNVHKVNLFHYYYDLVKKYGYTFGRYQGVKPVIDTVDPDLLKAIYVKNFDCFHDTFDFDLADKHKTVDLVGGETWRLLRKYMSPLFTSGKLKAMLHPMEEIINEEVDKVEKEVINSKGKEINIREFYQEMSLKIIAVCTMGISVKVNAGEKDKKLLDYGREASQNFQIADWFTAFIMQLTYHFPILEKIFPVFGEGYDNLYNSVDSMLKFRENIKDTVDQHDLAYQIIKLKKELQNNPEIAKIINSEVLSAQPAISFVAGIETVSSLLANFTYCMVLNPDIQETLYQEIANFIEEKGEDFDVEDIKELEFLDACLKETLRRLPPICQHNRMCVKDCTIKGIYFKKGTIIHLPIYASHHMEEFFPDPFEFKPERFFKSNADSIKEFTYNPFGGGPRQCIGQRFGLQEAKTSIIKFFHKIKFIATEETRKSEFYKGDLFFLSLPQLRVRIEKRS